MHSRRFGTAPSVAADFDAAEFSGHSLRAGFVTSATVEVPFTSFAEPDNGTYGGRAPVWFALDESRPLLCFAGIWTRWTSVRKVREGETTNDLFGFLTINPNAEVGAIHPKAMPVILRTAEECDTWLSARPPRL